MFSLSYCCDIQKKLEECVKLLNDYKTGALRRHVTDRELWEAQKIKQVRTALTVHLNPSVGHYYNRHTNF